MEAEFSNYKTRLRYCQILIRVEKKTHQLFKMQRMQVEETLGLSHYLAPTEGTRSF
jgi:hypothetical protein